MEHTVGVFTGYSESPKHKEGGWLEYITAGAAGAIREAGWHNLLLHPARLGEAQNARILDDPPAGVIVTDLPIETQPLRGLLFGLRDAGSQVVIYGDWPAFSDFDRVTSDHEAGAYTITRGLIERGRTRILQTGITPARDYWYAARRSGYERAMSEAGLPILPLLAIPAVSEANREVFEGGVRTLAGHLIEFSTGPNPVDAIFAPSDAHVFALGAACRLFGRKVGDDVLLAGYDNYWAEWPAREWENVAPVFTADKQNTRIGAALAQLLLERLRGDLPPQAQRRVVAPRLISL